MGYDITDKVLEIALHHKIDLPHGTEKSDTLQPVMQVIAASPLQKLVQKARFLLALDDHLHKHLPKQFSGLCSVMNVQHNTVIIQTTSAAVATRLRFLSDDLLSELQQTDTFKTIRQLDFKVRPK